MRFYDQKRNQFKRTRKRNLSIPAATASPFSVRLRKIESNSKINTVRTRENSPNFINNNITTPKIFRNLSKFPSGTKSKNSYSNNEDGSVLYEYEEEDSIEEPDFENMGNYFTNYSTLGKRMDETLKAARKRKITPLMRAILINWMGEVAEHFFMKRITLHLAVAYLDRYLFAIDIDVKKYNF